MMIPINMLSKQSNIIPTIPQHNLHYPRYSLNEMQLYPTFYNIYITYESLHSENYYIYRL